jgi:glycosidase
MPTATIEETQDTTQVLDPATPWYKTAVFYEIFVRSFYDSNGDGIGDFNGITEKLDYLNDGNPDTDSDLGIDAIWLMPIHPSPSYHGYDVINYYAVNSEYGTMGDFNNLLAEAHKRGIKIIIDMVLNHTSNQHPFFVNARQSDGSEYHDWYVWSDAGKGNYWHETTVGPSSKKYYGYFCDCMPDLNYLNPDVTEQMEQVVNFWISDVGVDGFRIDAAKHLIEDGDKVENTQLTHDWFNQFYTYYKGVNPETYVVGEVASSDARMTTLYSGDQMDMIFNFELAQGFVNSAKGESTSGVASAISFIQNDAPDWNFATFLTNHDQNRVMSVLNGNVDKAKVAAALLLTSPGTPFIYYGEEIGMLGSKPDEDIRLPMQWTDEDNAGFTSGMPWRLLNENYPQVNVELEESDPDSLLNAYKTLIELRKTYPAFSKGNYVVVETSNKGIYAALQQTEEQAILIFVNLSKNDLVDVAISWESQVLKDGNYHLKNLLGGTEANPFVIAGSKLSDYIPLDLISPYSINIYLLETDQ